MILGIGRGGKPPQFSECRPKAFFRRKPRFFRLIAAVHFSRPANWTRPEADIDAERAEAPIAHQQEEAKPDAGNVGPLDLPQQGALVTGQRLWVVETEQVAQQSTDGRSRTCEKQAHSVIARRDLG